MSSLALALIPLLRRDSSSELEAENARLRREIESLHREVEVVSKDRDNYLALVDGWRWRMAQRLLSAQLAQQAQMQQAQMQQAQMAAFNAMQNASNAMQNAMPHCNCVPSRAQVWNVG